PQTITVSKPGYETWTLQNVTPTNAAGTVDALMFSSAPRPTAHLPRTTGPASAAVGTTTRAATAHATPAVAPNANFHPSCSGWTSGLLPPPIIWVLVYANHTKDALGNVNDDKTSVNNSIAVDFKDYVETVLPMEWPANSPTEAWKAGAV